MKTFILMSARSVWRIFLKVIILDLFTKIIQTQTSDHI